MELLKRDKTATEVARAWGVHPTTIRNWQKEFMSKGPEIFSENGSTKEYEKKIA